MENTLTPDEMKFFETGELTGELAQQAAVAAPTPEPTPAPTPAPTTVQPTVEIPTANVDLSILQQRLAASEQAAREAADRVAEMEAKIAAAAPKPTAPPLDTDPLGHLLFKIDKVMEEVASIKNAGEQQTAQTQVERNFNSFVENVRTLKEQFVASNPDFDKAHEHVRNLRRFELQQLGLTEQQIEQEVIKYEVNMAQNAIKQGKNPAAVVYELAGKSGYHKQAPAVDEAARLKKIAEDAAATPSMPSKDAPVATDLTHEALKTASDADLSAIASDDAKWFKIVGGRSGGKGIF